MRRSLLSPATAEERFLLADAMTADSWRLAEAARRDFAERALAPPWLRGRERDARGHRELQRRLRELLGCSA